MQDVTFSPFYSAVDDYAKLADYSDFLKIATYNNAGGPRMAHFVDRLCSTIFADASPSDLQPLYYKIMGYDEADFNQIRTNELSPKYVASDTRRALGGTAARSRFIRALILTFRPQKAKNMHLRMTCELLSLQPFGGREWRCLIARVSRDVA